MGDVEDNNEEVEDVQEETAEEHNAGEGNEDDIIELDEETVPTEESSSKLKEVDAEDYTVNEEKCEEMDKNESESHKDEIKGNDVITVDDSADADITSKTVPDKEFFANVSEEEKKYYEENGPSLEKIDEMNIQCTACRKQVNHHTRNSIQRHPVLGVPVCRSCKCFYEDDGDWVKDDEGSECYCRWCANGGEMVCCDDCPNSFCKQCIQRNLGRAFFNKVNNCEKWKCFQCDPKPIYAQRALMNALSKWYILIKDKKKTREKEQKQKINQKKKVEEMCKIENFVDENINEAFDTLRIYQKCLEDEKKRWIRNKKAMTADSCGSIVTKLRKIYAITKQNMELLENALVQNYMDKFPDESMDKIKPGKIPGMSSYSPKGKPSPKPITPIVKAGAMVTNGKAVGNNKRKMKFTLKDGPPKKQSKPADDEDDIAVEEIVVNGEPVLSGYDDFIDPSQLCSIEMPGVSVPKPPKIGPVQRPTGPLRLSSKMFKKKASPQKPQRPPTPDSDIEEITIEDDDDVGPIVDDNADSDVSLE